jgi:hypothetical protein
MTDRFKILFDVNSGDPESEPESDQESDTESVPDEEIRGHVVESPWADERYYAPKDGYLPVLFKLDVDDNTVTSRVPGLPVFSKEQVKRARSFQKFFEDERYDEHDFEIAFFFIEFSLDELEKAGVVVPLSLEGYKWNPDEGTFEQVEKPTTPCGWDKHTQNWMPICTALDEKAHSCQSGKFRFDDHNLVVQNPPVCTHLLRTTYEAKDMRLMPALFARFGGPYCDCNCYCTNCGNFHLPSERKKHQPYGDGSGWPCD